MIYFLSESEFPGFKNFQNKVKVKTTSAWFSFCKFSNSANSDSDKKRVGWTDEGSPTRK